jgi:hypothetical protein
LLASINIYLYITLGSGVVLEHPAPDPLPLALSQERWTMVTEDNLANYYHVVDALWLDGSNPTLERIRERMGPRDSSNLTEGLAALIARRWLKVEQIQVSSWRPETPYETWYVPIREHDLETH